MKDKQDKANLSFQSYFINGIGLSDLEAVRLLLAGNSVVDWNRANFRTTAEVDRFLALNMLDVNVLADQERMKYVFHAAILYLEEHLQIKILDEIKKIEDIREIFIMASQNKLRNRRQILACTILKLMHVLQHLDAADLRYQVPLAEATLLEATEQKIISSKEALMSAHPNVLEFYGSRKTRESVISKLLAKKEDVASTVFDKLRFRIITKDTDDILGVLVWLTQHVFPFNFIIPAQSHNTLYPFKEMLKNQDMVEPLSNGIKDIEKDSNPNSFSGSSYKVINFIADVPVRIDHLVDHPFSKDLGKVVFVMVEFQIVNQVTAINNETGDCSHELYKERQLQQVKKRLQYGKQY